MSEKTHHPVYDVISAALSRERLTRDQWISVQTILAANLSILAPKTQRAIYKLLLTRDDLPKAFVQSLCLADCDGCLSFISASPQIDDHLAETIIKIYGCGVKTRALARRITLSKTITSMLRALDDPKIDRAMELRQKPSLSLHFEPAKTLVEPMPAISEPDRVKLMELANDPNPAVLHTAIADHTGLSVGTISTIFANPQSQNFLLLMKFMAFSTSRALDLYARVSGSLPAEDERQEFITVYGEITGEYAAARLAVWKLEELSTIAQFGIAANEDIKALSSEEKPKRSA